MKPDPYRFLVSLALLASACTAQNHAAVKPTGATPTPTAAPTTAPGSAAPSARPATALVGTAALAAPKGASAAVSGNLTVDASYLVSSRIGQLISQDGGTAVYPAASLIGQDGATIVAQGGGNLISQDGGTMLANDGATLISQDGGTLISQDGGTIVAQGGGNIVAQGGGNIVAQGGGNYRLAEADATLPDDRLAAGFAIRAISMANNRPVSLGVDAKGHPVYTVLTDAKGHYQLYLPDGLQDNVRLVASPLGSSDPRATVVRLIQPQGDQGAWTEVSSARADYLRQALVGKLRPLIAHDASLAKLDPGLATVVQKLIDAGKTAGVSGLSAAQQEEFLVRLADVGLAKLDLADDLKIESGVENYVYTGDPQYAYQSLESAFAAARVAAKAKLDQDPDYFQKQPYMIAANERRRAAGRAVNAPVRKPSDVCRFMIEEYLSDMDSGHQRLVRVVLDDLGLPPALGRRLIAALTTSYTSIGIQALASEAQLEGAIGDIVKDMTGAHPPKLPALPDLTGAAAAPPAAPATTADLTPVITDAPRATAMVAVDHQIYYVSGNHEVHWFDPATGKPGGAIVFPASVQLWGLAYDAATRMLYASDYGASAIYQCDLSAATPTPVPFKAAFPAGDAAGAFQYLRGLAISPAPRHALVVAEAEQVNLQRLAQPGDLRSVDLDDATHPVKTLASELEAPIGLAVGAAGDVFYTDASSHGEAVMQVGLDGHVRDYAGYEAMGFADGYGSNARFGQPQALAFLPDGRLVVADSGNHALRLVTPEPGGFPGRYVSTLAGGPSDGTAPPPVAGPGKAAHLGSVGGVLVVDGKLYFSDTDFGCIYAVTLKD